MLYTCRHALARLAGGFALPGTVADYQPWFDNHKRLRELIAELQALSLAITENDPRWDRYAGPPGTSTPPPQNRNNSLRIVSADPA